MFSKVVFALYDDFGLDVTERVWPCQPDHTRPCTEEKVIREGFFGCRQKQRTFAKTFEASRFAS